MYSKTHDVEKLEDDHPATWLYETYGRIIFSYLRAQGITLPDAEDLLTEIFLAAMAQDNLSALPPEGQLLWLKRVAHNKQLNAYRQRHRHPQVPLETVVETECEEKGPEQIALQQEERHQLRRHIRQLPALQQLALQLRYSDELTYKEIASLLNKREGTVRKLVSRAILVLRRTFQQREGEHTW